MTDGMGGYNAGEVVSGMAVAHASATLHKASLIGASGRSDQERSTVRQSHDWA